MKMQFGEGETHFTADAIQMLFALPTSLGYAGVLILVVNAAPRLLRPLSFVGRMAFTNYLMQTVICVFIFYGGVGLGYFGSFERWEQLLLVLSIWAFQIVFSLIWLSIFRAGPLEWLWRSATYLKAVPLRK